MSADESADVSADLRGDISTAYRRGLREKPTRLVFWGEKA